jgi:hypothetical protein
MHFKIERLASLPEEVDGSGRQQPKAPGLLPAAANAVDQATKILEEVWKPMDLIEDHQLVFVRGNVELRFRELGSVRIGLEIEIDRRPCLGYFERKRSLADLARPN